MINRNLKWLRRIIKCLGWLRLVKFRQRYIIIVIIVFFFFGLGCATELYTGPPKGVEGNAQGPAIFRGPGREL